ncbi:MAG TPA: hypothetical protein V6D21_05585, partial [Candidatus Obscuribacterales bacterium]
EEIGYNVPEFSHFNYYADSLVNRIVFYAPLTVDLSQLVLNEGWDMGLLTPEDIQAGECYSKKAGMVRLIGNLHRKILLDFMAQKLV